jgi:hypothetical protein
MRMIFRFDESQFVYADKESENMDKQIQFQKSVIKSEYIAEKDIDAYSHLFLQKTNLFSHPKRRNIHTVLRVQKYNR